MVLEKSKNVKIDKHDLRLHSVFYVMLALMVVVGVVYPIISLAAFGLLSVYILLAKQKNVFMVLFFIMSFANMFKYSEGATSLFTYVTLLACVKLIFIQKKINIHFLVAWLIFFAFLILGFKMNFTVLIKQAIILPMVYLFFVGEKPDIKDFTITYTNGLLLSSFIALFKDSIPNITKYIVYESTFELAEDVQRFSGFYSDPNYYSLALLLALSNILVLYANKRLGVMTYIYYILIAFFGAQTVSKSFFLLFAFLSVFFVFILLQNKKYKTTLVFFLFIAVIVFLIVNGNFSIFNNVIERLLSSDGGDITTGRSDIWARYLSFFNENILKLIFGSGIGADYLMTYPHNTYIDFLFFYGIFGSIMFFVVLIFALGIKERFKRSISNYFPLIAALTCFMFLSSLMYYDFLFILIYVSYTYLYDFRKKKVSLDHD